MEFVKKQIKQSIEYKRYKHDLIFLFAGYLIIMGVCSAIIFVMLNGYKDYALKLFTVYAVGFSCIWLSFIFLYVYKLMNIFRKKDKFTFFETVLCESVKSFGGRKFVIDVSPINSDVKKIMTSTFNNTLKYPSYEKFINKKILVGLNVTTNIVILIEM